MPVIVQPNPLTAASDAVGGYTETKNINRDRALALAAERERLGLQRESIESEKDYRNRQLDMEGRAQDDAHLRTMSEIETNKQTAAITQERYEYEKTQRPLAEQLAKLQIDVQRGAIDANTAQLKFQAIQTKASQIDLDFKNKLHVLGLDVKGAELALQQTAANIAATIAQKVAAYASANASNASAYRQMHPIGLGGVAGQKYKDEQNEELRIKTTVDRVKKSPSFMQLPPALANTILTELEKGRPTDEVLLLIRAGKDDKGNAWDEQIVQNVAKSLGVQPPVHSQQQPQQGGVDWGKLLGGAAQWLPR